MNAPWDLPTFVGSAGKLGTLALAGREGFGQIPAGGATSGGPTLPVYAIRSAPLGSSQIHHVNMLDPGTSGYWIPQGDHGAVVPAGRGY